MEEGPPPPPEQTTTTTTPVVLEDVPYMEAAAKDLAFLTELQKAYDTAKAHDEDFPTEDAKPVTELATIMMMHTSEKGHTTYYCDTCQTSYKMLSWAARHLVNNHLTSEKEKSMHCKDCNVMLHRKKGETAQEMLDRHNNSPAHQASVKYPTMSGHNRKVIFCPNVGCGQIFKDSTTGKKHKNRCDNWSVEKREATKKKYLSPEEHKTHVEAHFKPMPWDGSATK